MNKRTEEAAAWTHEANAAGRVLDAAVAVARSAPKKQNVSGGVTHALIYWPFVWELREALDALGIEWRPDVTIRTWSE